MDKERAIRLGVYALMGVFVGIGIRLVIDTYDCMCLHTGEGFVDANVNTVFAYIMFSLAIIVKMLYSIRIKMKEIETMGVTKDIQDDIMKSLPRWYRYSSDCMGLLCGGIMLVTWIAVIHYEDEITSMDPAIGMMFVMSPFVLATIAMTVIRYYRSKWLRGYMEEHREEYLPMIEQSKGDNE